MQRTTVKCLQLNCGWCGVLQQVNELQLKMSRFHGLTAANPERKTIGNVVKDGCESLKWQVGGAPCLGQQHGNSMVAVPQRCSCYCVPTAVRGLKPGTPSNKGHMMAGNPGCIAVSLFTTAVYQLSVPAACS